MIRIGTTLTLYMLCIIVLQAQETTTRDNYVYSIIRSKTTINIDGIDSPGEWQNHQLIDTLYNHNPSDEGIANYKSEIRLTYDDKNLYIITKHFDDGHRIIQSLERDSDVSQWGSESLTIAIDPINKKQSGIMIGVNAGGAEVDGSLEVEPSRTTYSDSWDGRWFSATQQYSDHWITEIAIPFSTLRYNEDNLEWGINFIRGHKTENFYYTWTPFPINFNGIDVNYMGTLKWTEVPKVKSKIAYLKPYGIATSYKDNSAQNTDPERRIDAGLDAKIGITKSLNADLTFNPDFSNADVDQEITNITRFDISLPEQREFFLENADIFARFGSRGVVPFFSRRIGLASPISYGSRVTGNITDNLRTGVMNIQTRSNEEMSAQNHTAAAFNLKVLNRSQLKGLFLNRQETGGAESADFARSFGGEFTYVSKKGNFNNSIKYHKSSTAENRNGSFYALQGNYITRNIGTGWNIDIVEKDYDADLGFTPRLFNYNADTDEVIRQGYTFLNPWVRYTHYVDRPESKIISHVLRTWHLFYLDERATLSERINNFAYDLRLKNTSQITLSGEYRDVDLRYPTNFLGSEYENLPIQQYGFWSAGLSYDSDSRKALSYNASVNYGGFFNGYRYSIRTSASMRFGYWANLGISYGYNDIRLPDNYGEVALHLIRFRGLLSFTNKLSLNNTIQYNTQSKNFSVFSRLQWRYSPLSDIFLIYNQNNNTDGFNLKNRSIILKSTYQFGV